MVLQQLVYLAAQDGNAPALSMLLTMFERTPWLVRRPSVGAGPQGVGQTRV